MSCSLQNASSLSARSVGRRCTTPMRGLLAFASTLRIDSPAPQLNRLLCFRKGGRDTGTNFALSELDTIAQFLN
ncbi:hypothetical protein QQF64_029528 [Cirrhinus molitorella]|uniref:Uncharacterized protein n=1 Tax=Cirrhinus molitorella TaxID=172907 RepID=A0ABR3N0Q9_9TELE